MKKDKLNCGIYRIRNKINNNCYIGQSTMLDQRKWYHFSCLKYNKSRHPILQNAVNKYGIKNFIFEILLFCDKENLTYFEQICVNKFKPKYNYLKECVNSPLGSKRTIAQKEYMRKRRIIAYLNRYRKEYPFYYKKIINNFPNITETEEYSFYRNLHLKIKKNNREPKKFNGSYILFDNEYNKNIRVNITQSELDIIKSFNDRKYQKFLFTILVLSKYYFYNKETDDYIFDKKISSIFNTCGIHITRENKQKFIENIINLKYIEKIGNYYKINFVNNNSPTIILIDDFSKIIKFLPFYCEHCGKQIPNRYRFCDSCLDKKEEERIWGIPYNGIL
jgi:group I intron endonuclease